MNQDMEKILTGNHSLLKNLNSKGILSLIRTKAPISGSNLAKIAGMRLSAVHNILINLDKKGLVLKIGTGDSTKLGGRRTTLWRICGHYGYVVGIQLEIN
jgi:DNA-binding Lrp family transcriptional regulator